MSSISTPKFRDSLPPDVHPAYLDPKLRALRVSTLEGNTDGYLVALLRDRAYVNLGGKACFYDFRSGGITSASEFQKDPSVACRTVTFDFLDSESGKPKTKQVPLYQEFVKSSYLMQFEDIDPYLPGDGTRPELVGFPETGPDAIRPKLYTWQGIRGAQLKGHDMDPNLAMTLVEPFRTHLFNVVCSSRVEVFDALETWIANILQEPMIRRCPYMPILTGGMGNGKTMTAEIIMGMIGSYASYLDTCNNVFGGEFTRDALNGKIFIAIDEASRRVTHSADSLVKSYITNDTVTLKQKFMPDQQVRSFARFMMMSNQNPVKVGDNARRFLPLSLKDKEELPFDYFDTLSRFKREEELIGALYSFYAHYEYDKSVELYFPPVTDLILNSIESQASTIDKLYLDILKEGRIAIPTEDESRAGYEREYLVGVNSNGEIFVPETMLRVGYKHLLDTQSHKETLANNDRTLSGRINSYFVTGRGASLAGTGEDKCVPCRRSKVNSCNMPGLMFNRLYEQYPGGQIPVTVIGKIEDLRRTYARRHKPISMSNEDAYEFYFGDSTPSDELTSLLRENTLKGKETEGFDV